MPNATLSVVSKAVAYSDSSINNNPRLRHFDWTRTHEGLQVANPRTEPIQIVAGEASVIFNGLRTLTLDATTRLTVTRSSIEPARHRFTYSSGTLPGFRVRRSAYVAEANFIVTVNGDYITFEVDPDSRPPLPPFDGVVAGDYCYITHDSLGYPEGSVFSIENCGEWVVISVDGGVRVEMRRPPGVSFNGKTEVVSVQSNGIVQFYSASGVQVGDTLDISGGFASSTRRAYKVKGVTSSWVEVESSQPLLLENSVLVGVGNMVFYSMAKQFLRIEADQECVVRLNGDTGNSIRLSPVEAGDPERPGWFEKYGPVYSLTIMNSSIATANVLILSAE